MKEQDGAAARRALEDYIEREIQRLLAAAGGRALLDLTPANRRWHQEIVWAIGANGVLLHDLKVGSTLEPALEPFRAELAVLLEERAEQLREQFRQLTEHVRTDLELP